MNYLSSALEVLRILNNHNYDAYIVGGFVRDYLLNIDSGDIDLTSSATPEEVEKLFKIVPTGIKYGTVLIMYNGYTFEHTTFRFDGSYNDSRHPNSIMYSKNITDDIKRRDFTINSILMDKDKKIIDYLDGKADLDKKVIKTIGNPNDRFNEDALRMLRAISFVSKLGFDIESDTLKSMKENKDLLKNVSVERIRIEFDKISNGKYRSKAWELFYELGYNKLFHNMPSVKNYDKSFIDIVLDSLVESEEISDFWQFSKNDISNLKKASKMIKNGFNDYDLFINGFKASKYTLDYLKIDISRYENLKIKTLKDLNINGNDISFIIKNKRNDCLNYLAKLVLEENVNNSFDELIKEAKKWNI